MGPASAVNACPATRPCLVLDPSGGTARGGWRVDGAAARPGRGCHWYSAVPLPPPAVAPSDPILRTTLRPPSAPLPDQGNYRLLVINETEHRTLRLPPAGEVSIGRSDAADVQISDPLLSRVHAVLRVGEGLTVRDRGSSNGTVVRGERIAPDVDVPIAVGDTIEVGSTMMIVQPTFALTESRPAPASATSTAGPAPAAEPPARDDAMARVHALARRIARSQINVLLLGETGVGKEVMAHAIHQLSARAEGPFVGINCAAVSDALFESELFGHERGAFTGATQTKPGLVETAHHGTVFLDEVGEMPLSTQAKLLRVLETRQVMRVGSLRPREVDVRIVAATNQNLEQDVQTGRFREDLYYRLNGISLVIPPLRERVSEIPELAQRFIGEAAREAGLPAPPVLSGEAVRWMERYAWPGNIRELRNAVNRAVILVAGGVILPEQLQPESYQPRTGRGSGRPVGPGLANAEASGAGERPLDKAVGAAGERLGWPSERAAGADEDGPPVGLSEADLEERQRIIDALTACGGNQTRAARMLGIARRTLTSRLDRLALPRPRKGR
jgi:two-component system, NtrC family, response regulator AtoC